MENNIYNFLVMLLNEFITPLKLALVRVFNSMLYNQNKTFLTFFNWLFNIGRETPVNYFDQGYPASYFFFDILVIVLIIISIHYLIKLIKVIFKPIFKLLNAGGDTKWRR